MVTKSLSKSWLYLSDMSVTFKYSLLVQIGSFSDSPTWELVSILEATSLVYDVSPGLYKRLRSGVLELSLTFPLIF